MPQSEQHRELSRRTLSRRATERIVGAMLFGYIVAVAIQVVTRALSYDSQVPFDEAILTIAANQNLYLTSMYSGLVANFLLVVLAAGLYSIFAVHQVHLARIGAVLLLGAAIVSLMSSGSGLAVASLIREFTGDQLRPGSALSSTLAVESIRETFGRIGFTLSALGVVALGALIAWSGTLPRWLGWLGIAAGISMFFIWMEAATSIHRLGGAGYLLWLAIMGGWLIVRGTQHDSEVV